MNHIVALRTSVSRRRARPCRCALAPGGRRARTCVPRCRDPAGCLTNARPLPPPPLLRLSRGARTTLKPPAHAWGCRVAVALGGILPALSLPPPPLPLNCRGARTTPRAPAHARAPRWPASTWRAACPPRSRRWPSKRLRWGPVTSSTSCLRPRRSASKGDVV